MEWSGVCVCVCAVWGDPGEGGARREKTLCEAKKMAGRMVKRSNRILGVCSSRDEEARARARVCVCGMCVCCACVCCACVHVCVEEAEGSGFLQEGRVAHFECRGWGLSRTRALARMTRIATMAHAHG